MFCASLFKTSLKFCQVIKIFLIQIFSLEFCRSENNLAVSDRSAKADV
jgi:hypothetical protein